MGDVLDAGGGRRRLRHAGVDGRAVRAHDPPRGAVVLWTFALFYWFIDIKGRKAWAFPLVVVGMNSIAIYVAYQLTAGWIRSVVRPRRSAAPGGALRRPTAAPW